MLGSLPIQQFIVYVNSKKTAENVKNRLKSEDIDTTCFILIQADYYDKEIYPNINPD
jgi:hypothetical protein